MSKSVFKFTLLKRNKYCPKCQSIFLEKYLVPTKIKGKLMERSVCRKCGHQFEMLSQTVKNVKVFTKEDPSTTEEAI
jgi:DNA-directed RNA polymerase subunit M/transcription elongation factor TFIIS